LARALYWGAGVAEIAGEIPQAITWFQEATDWFAVLAETAPDPYGILQGQAFNDFRTLYYRQEAYADAEMFFSGATSIFRDLLETHDLPVIDELAMVLFHWGNSLREQEKWFEALRHYQECLHFREQLWQEAPEDASRQADLASVLIECAACIRSGESISVAESYFQEGIQRFLALANSDPDQYLFSFGRACLRFGLFYQSVDENQNLSVHYAEQAIIAFLQLELDDDIRYFVHLSLQLLRDWGIDDQAFLQRIINQN
jgi:tetratricopeptide (TPR) repeat protein